MDDINEAMKNFALVKAYVDKHKVNYWDAIYATVKGKMKQFRDLHELVLTGSGETKYEWSHTYKDTKKVLDKTLEHYSIF